MSATGVTIAPLIQDKRSEITLEYYPDDLVIIARPGPRKRDSLFKALGVVMQMVVNPDRSISYYIQEMKTDQFDDHTLDDIVLGKDTHIATSEDLKLIARGEVYKYLRSEGWRFRNNWKAELAYVLKYGLAERVNFFTLDLDVSKPAERTPLTLEVIKRALVTNQIHGFDDEFNVYRVSDFDAAQRIRMEALVEIRALIKGTQHGDAPIGGVAALPETDSKESQFHQLISGKLGVLRPTRQHQAR